jgi:hypothetical protein
MQWQWRSRPEHLISLLVIAYKTDSTENRIRIRGTMYDDSGGVDLRESILYIARGYSDVDQLPSLRLRGEYGTDEWCTKILAFPSLFRLCPKVYSTVDFIPVEAQVNA